MDGVPEDVGSRDELCCPLCGYRLRGLVDPRCPECGFAFSWRELIDAGKHRHPYLFEHGSSRSFVTFFKTIWFTNLPWKFWTDLHPAMPVNRRRLWLYWFLSNALFLGVLAVPLIHVAVALGIENHNLRYRTKNYRAGGHYNFSWLLMSPAQFRRSYPLVSEREFPAAVWHEAFAEQNRKKIPGLSLSELDLPAVPIFLAWPFASLVTLLIFRVSMRKASIKPEHVLRTVLYSCDFGLVLIPIGMVIDDSLLELSLGSRVFWIMAACALFATFRITFAFSRYLWLHRPFATVLATQTIVFLLMFVVVMGGFGYVESILL